MCSNADIEVDGVTLMEVKILDLNEKLCKKCGLKNEAKVVLRRKDAYCKNCFLSSVTHKFRACLGKSKAMRPGDKVVVGFSGSNNSTALLHLIQTGLQETSHKKLMFTPCLVYVDESSVLNLKPEESNSENKNISTFLKEFGYPSYTVPLELSTMPEEVMKEYLVHGSYSNDKSFSKLFNSLADNTSRIDMLNKLRNNLLAKAAALLGCGKVFTAESADDLAIKLLTNMSLGRGSQLPYDVGFLDNRYPDIKVIRPLRDLSKKELAFYNVFHKLSCIHVPSLSTKSDVNSSIQKLTESFLSELQDGFPSTLSTVFRVADKLSSNSDVKNVCPLCKAPLDIEALPSSSSSATHFSRIVSASGPSDFDVANLKIINSNSSSSGCGGGSTSCGEGCTKKTTKEELQAILCYGCNLILQNANIDKLPAQMMKTLKESSQRCKMRRDIEDFLL